MLLGLVGACGIQCQDNKLSLKYSSQLATVDTALHAFITEYRFTKANFIS